MSIIPYAYRLVARAAQLLARPRRHPRLYQKAIDAERFSGPSHVMQAECDASGSRILQRYITFRQFARITKGITQRGGAASEAKVDSREVRNLSAYPYFSLALQCRKHDI